MQEEVWKDVVGYEGTYQVSNLGEVRSIDRHDGNRLRKGITLKKKLNDYGYYSVHLRNKQESKESWPCVHRVVAQAFVTNTDNKPTVNHINGIKTDNSSVNLEWATMSEQTRHAFDNNLMFVRGNTLYNEEFKEGVKEYHTENSLSLKKLAKHFNISECTARRIVKGQYGDARKSPKHVISKAKWLREQGFTLHKIGEILGKNFSTIHNWVGNKVINDGC